MGGVSGGQVLSQMLSGPSVAPVLNVFHVIFLWAPLWLPPLLAYVVWQQWIAYRRARFIAGEETVLLELLLPAEVMKTPAAMETVFDGLNLGPGEYAFTGRWWKGAVRPWWTVELVSTEGQVHIYMWTRRSFQRHIERNLYAQYPTMEINIVEDYAVRFPFNLAEHAMWGCDYKLTRPDCYPIKSYVDFKLDATQTKEEQKVDPMANVIEFLGSMGKGEHLWLQIHFRLHKKEPRIPGTLVGITNIAARGQAEVKKIRANPETSTFYADKEYKVISDFQKKQIELIERKIYSKLHFDTGVRGIYMAEKEYYDRAVVGALQKTFKVFSAPGFNEIGTNDHRWHPKFNYPWQDFNNHRQDINSLELLDAFRRRSWFHPPYRYPSYVLSSEELATIFHVPGSVVQTPSLQRIPSTRREAPPNLPV